MLDAAANAKMLKTCMTLYAIFAACALSAFVPLWSVVILSTVALLAAIAIAYGQREKAGDSLYESHFHWLIRTFWIGGFVYLPVLTVLCVLAVYAIIDWSDVEAAIKTAALEHASSPNVTGPDDAQVVINTVIHEVADKNQNKIAAIVFCFIFPAIAWWLWRCWKGWNLLKKGQPVPDVMKWV